MKFRNPFIKLRGNQALLSARKEYGYLGYAFLFPAVIMLSIYIALGHKPFGDFCVLTLDLNAQYVYFYEALREFLCGDASLLYSFSRTLGGEFMGIYAYYIASPLSYIVLLFPKSMMLFALLTIIIIKIGLCGLSFGFYLHKQTKNINKNNIIMFAVMYGLSAYTITYQNNIMWLDGLILLPILTYAIERLIKQGKYKLYIATLALMMMSHYYIGYMLCWYTAFCFFFTYFKDTDRKLVNPRGDKLHFVKSVARMGASTLLGIGIAAFIIGGAYYSLQFGKNEFTDPNWDWVARFDLFDLFPRLLPGSYDTVMHEGIPLLYSGVLTLFMLPLYFTSKRVENREKLFYTALTVIYVLIMVINPLDLVMHGFQMPNCLNYRYSFIVIFLLLIMAYKGFCELREHSTTKIFATGAAILALLAIAQKMSFPNFILSDTEEYKYGFIQNKLPFFWVVVFSIIAVIATGAALYHVIKHIDAKKSSQVLLTVVCIELFLNGLVTFCSMRYDIGWSSYSSYHDYLEQLTPIVETVQGSDKTFYRSEKTTHRCTNDNMALNIKGLSNSTSTLNQKAIDLLIYLGISGDAHWTQYLGSTVITDSLFGIKYIYSNIANDWNKESLTQNEFMDIYYEKVAEDDYYYAYKNPYALGLAFGIDEALKDLELETKYDFTTKEGLKNPFLVQNMLLNTLLGNCEDEQIEFFKPIVIRKNQHIIGTTGTVGGGLEYSTSVIEGEEKFVEFNFTVEESGPLYLYLPTQYEKTFTLFVNEEFYVTNYTHSRIISLGHREAGEELQLKFRLDEHKLYFFKDTNYLYTLNMDAFEEAFEELSKTSLQTSEKSTDDHIFGTLTTHESNKTILTTIPYDAGWRVYVDGERVETYKIMGDTLMAFDIENAGEHSIELRYMPDIYVITGIISAVSTVIFIVLIVIDRKKAKKVVPSPCKEPENGEASVKNESECEKANEIDTESGVDIQIDNEKTEGEN